MHEANKNCYKCEIANCLECYENDNQIKCKLCEAEYLISIDKITCISFENCKLSENYISIDELECVSVCLII